MDHRSQPPSNFGLQDPIITRSKIISLNLKRIFTLIHPHNSSTALTTYSQAQQPSDWQIAMQQKIMALHDQNTWIFVSPPSNALVLDCERVYRTKIHLKGSIVSYKARLITQENNQEYCLNYFETLSLVDKMPSIRILLTITLNNAWQVHLLDVSYAFLHGPLDTTIYMMKQLVGFIEPLRLHHVCLLNKALYGLKQAPRQWFFTFSSHLNSLGFHVSKDNPCFFYLSSKGH